MKKTFAFYHGDLDLFKIDTLPKTAKLLDETKQHIPQHSDSTGHSHTIASDKPFKVYQYGETVLYDFSGPAAISHEEHRTEDFAPGIYLLEHEKEEDPRSGLVTEVQD
jgi:hypothetical protein